MYVNLIDMFAFQETTQFTSLEVLDREFHCLCCIHKMARAERTEKYG